MTKSTTLIITVHCIVITPQYAHENLLDTNTNFTGSLALKQNKLHKKKHNLL